MVENPEKYVEPMSKAGVNQITFHFEATSNPKDLIDSIHSKQIRASITIKPKTDVSKILPFIDDVDMILIMTVEPGFCGQKFMDDMMGKVQTLRKLKPKLDIEVDGGLNPSSIDIAARAGANCIVAGAIFITDNPKGMISELRNNVEMNILKKDMQNNDNEIEY
jgi:ribulose-phosphate 3-epimerase